jgi:capsular exopolysaccharide synthesis family protein
MKELHNLVLEKDEPAGREIFRQIHSQILLKNKNSQKGQAYVVTSALPKEGKSFFAINLAASFSKHHYHTLLIDCDFRRPTIGQRLKASLGGTSHLPGGRPVHLTETLDVLPFSQSSSEATELIESAAFKEAMQSYRSTYDVIIIDTPPAGLFPDAGLIGKLADHFIFVTQLNKHRKAALKAILNRLDESEAQILGVVVNKVTRSKSRNLGAYRYMDYTKYKNYYPSVKEAKTTTA